MVVIKEAGSESFGLRTVQAVDGFAHCGITQRANTAITAILQSMRRQLALQFTNRLDLQFTRSSLSLSLSTRQWLQMTARKDSAALLCHIMCKLPHFHSFEGVQPPDGK